MAFTIDQESVLFPLMEWSPGLFGQLNDGVVSGAGFVSNANAKLSRSGRVPMYPVCSAVGAHVSLGMVQSGYRLHIDLQRAHLIALGNL